jgi:FAD:protein FMN transferase
VKRAQPPIAGAEPPTVVVVEDHVLGHFRAMGGPCEVLIDTRDRDAGEALVAIAAEEAWRIERKFSRYRADSMVQRLNTSGGRPVRVDSETALLLDYAVACWESSDGLFDITSGVLRQAWRFDGSSRVPDPYLVSSLLEHVGWQRVGWDGDTLTLPAGMEIDLGGIGKEYAVDRAATRLREHTAHAVLVNFGGDLFASAPRRGNRAWAVGIDDPGKTGISAVARIELQQGGLATSGDARRFVIWQGRRLGHILDPRTGWPVEDAPSSVTVMAPTCIEAGSLSTLAYLRGKGAREFLTEQGVEFWIVPADSTHA